MPAVVRGVVVDLDLAAIIKAWCAAAEPFFKCRNNIFHGVSVSFDGTWAGFINGPQWTGEERAKTETFSADDHTLALMEDAFGMLLRGIIWIERTARAGANAGAPATIQGLSRGLSDARSVGWELHDLAGAVNNEKY